MADAVSEVDEAVALLKALDDRMRANVLVLLKKYGEHGSNCGYSPQRRAMQTDYGPCTCGLKEILDAASLAGHPYRHPEGAAWEIDACEDCGRPHAEHPRLEGAL